nr:hypothetical protein [Kofleriaceae bacterium]
MAEQETRRWQRISRLKSEVGNDPLQALRAAIARVRQTPRDVEARRELRMLGSDQAAREQLALLLTDEVRANRHPDIAAAFYEELADVHENLDQPLETIAAMEAVCSLLPHDVDHLDRLAWLYRRAGAARKAAESFERLAGLLGDDPATHQRARAALHAAGALHRETANLERAIEIYRAILATHPSDKDAGQALDELLAQAGRFRELADLRGDLAARSSGTIDKAALLRAQARALEQAGDTRAAANAVAAASTHAPDDISGVVDYANVLARDGRGREAARMLADGVAEAIARGAGRDDVAALRARHAAVLEDACGDRVAAAEVLRELLADAPDFVPALERLVWHAQHDADPAAYPAALLRHAHALAAGPDKAALLVEAGRRFRDARDYRASAMALEAAVELVGDADLRRELEQTRALLEVERAGADTARGDDARAERRLRALLASQPLHVPAIIALAELLGAAGRHAEAVEHLQSTLGAAPDPTPARLAGVVHRYALAVAALGEPDDAHQLLHDAHALDRRDPLITLALGESCFQRRLWREAALHLGSLAEHPDAPKHARAIAAGLVHAGLAEIRALRPANAEKRFEAAARLDPACARAWHELAERAMDRGETARAADCLEREADAATEPAERLRLFDALGDLAQGVLGDVARAERCWAAVADLGSAEVLHKLLVVQRARGAGRERGETCERLFELADKRERKELAEEAAQAFSADGETARARVRAQWLASHYPQDVDALTCATAVWRDAGDPAPIAAALARATAAWDGGNDRGDGDARRAELWRRLGDAERARGDGAAAQRAYERAVVLAPDSDGALAARRGLVDLGAGAPAGLLAALVEAEHSPADVLAWARELARAPVGANDQVDDARAVFDLARALGAQLDARDDAAIARAPARELASDEGYASALTPAERAELIDDPSDAPLAQLLDALGEVAARIVPDSRGALAVLGLTDARRVSSLDDAAAVAMWPQIARMLGGPPTLLHASVHDPRGGGVVVAASPPLVVLGQSTMLPRRIVATDAGSGGAARLVELRFSLGRLVELTRPRRALAAGTTPAAFATLVAGLDHAFGRTAGTAVAPEVAREAERLRAALPVQTRRFVGDYLAATSSVDSTGYLAACERAADRAGLIACGRADVAIAATGGPSRARHLVRLAASPRYLAVRRRLTRRTVSQPKKMF